VNNVENGHAENLRGVTARATRAADRGQTFTICGVEFTIS